MKKKSKKLLLNTVISISTAVFVICFAAVLGMYINSLKAEKEIDDLKPIIVFEDNDTDNSIENCVAWLEIPNTDIDYPVMQKENDPEYYLHRNYKGEYSYSGTPFLDGKCGVETSRNLIIYGHNMRDGTMFSDLMKYKDTDYCKEHSVVYLTVDNTVYEYELYAVCKVLNNDEWYTFNDKISEKELDNLISHIKDKSLYISQKEAQYGDCFFNPFHL
ncbi:MAG: class B sortase [Clostridiales bacterium]|nr:class B sortase [Clostridiales bacterium]